MLNIDPWVRPALWLMPVTDIYGGFPASGEIDMMESSGNWFYYCGQQSRGEVISTYKHLCQCVCICQERYECDDQHQIFDMKIKD